MRITLITAVIITLFSAYTLSQGTKSSPSSFSGIDYSNPALIAGSDFGTFLQQLAKQGRWTTLLSFITNESRKHYGDKKIMSSFKEFDWGFRMRLKFITIEREKVRTLNYEVDRFATKSIFRLNVTLENDTCKLVIKSIPPL